VLDGRGLDGETGLASALVMTNLMEHMAWPQARGLMHRSEVTVNQRKTKLIWRAHIHGPPIGRATDHVPLKLHESLRLHNF
jgi:hypothetical protein